MTNVKGPSRSPRGSISDKPVYVGLSPDERIELESLAAEKNLSYSRMARELIRVGMRTIKRNAPSSRLHF
jgi:hypothetical protein